MMKKGGGGGGEGGGRGSPVVNCYSEHKSYKLYLLKMWYSLAVATLAFADKAYPAILTR